MYQTKMLFEQAIKYNNVEQLNKLLSQHETNLSIFNSGETPLHFAIINNK